MSNAEQKLMILEAEIVGKIAKESDNLPNQMGHNQSFARGFLEGLEWVMEQFSLTKSEDIHEEN